MTPWRAHRVGSIGANRPSLPADTLRAVAVAMVAVIRLAAPAGAAEPTDSGWWWRVQSGQVMALPAPPGVPEGTLLVQGSPDGASAVAAVRFALEATETAPVLSLRLTADSGAAAATAVVLACPAARAWRSGSAQPWPEKPEPDCSRQAIGAPNADGTAMVFDLSSFASAPVVDVVLVPGRVPDLPVGLDGSSFTLVFEKPAAGDLVTVAAGAPVSSLPASGGAAAPATASSGTGFTSSAPAVTPRPSAPSFLPPSVAVTPALPAADVARPGASDSPAVTVPPFIPAADDEGGIGLALALLVATGLGAAFLARRDAVLALLGRPVAVAESNVAGLGRFARSRDGQPPSLL